MLFRQWLALTSIGLTAASPVKQKRANTGFDFGSEKVRGVSIGGWLVSEPFISPSLYENLPSSVVDEYTMGQYLGVDQAKSILQAHWDSWATLADFERIASMGFNTVRIPIGYWAFLDIGDPFVTGPQVDYLDSAIGWARSTGLKVWIDLHGAPKSQNGFDNSGERLDTPGWLTVANSLDQTYQVLQIIADKYAQTDYNDVVVAIEVLNEPLTSNLNGGFDALLSFYEQAYSIYRAPSPVGIMYQDGFLAPRTWNGDMSPSDDNAQNVIIDDHYYQIFNSTLEERSTQEHIDSVCTDLAPYYSGRDKWLVTGEFTAAMDDCAMWVNGRGYGARYDGTYATSYTGSTYIGDCNTRNNSANWSADFKQQTRAYIERQIDVIEQLNEGWVFWNFKTETAPAWSVFALDDLGIFPQPLTQRLYGSTICSD